MLVEKEPCYYLVQHSYCHSAVDLKSLNLCEDKDMLEQHLVDSISAFSALFLPCPSSSQSPGCCSTSYKVYFGTRLTSFEPGDP